MITLFHFFLASDDISSVFLDVSDSNYMLAFIILQKTLMVSKI
jgi:hypothetical protein